MIKKKLTVLLINPPQVFIKSAGPPLLFHPTGLAYVAAAIEKDFKVIILDASAESRRGIDIIDDKYHLGLQFDDLAERIRAVNPDVVGISIPFSVNRYAGLKTAETAKSVNKSIVTILGGPHPSIQPVETLMDPHVDYVVINEGEVTAPELLKKIEDSSLEELDKVLGIGFKKDGKPVLTPPRPAIADLDSVPFPARHLLPMDLYFEAEKLGIKARALYNMGIDKKLGKNTSIITSRGCPFTCNFCSIHLTMGHAYRKRSPENVIKEIEEVISMFGITHIDFEDDNFTFDKDRLRRICDMIVEKKLNITWSTPNGIRADIIDEDLVIRMKKSGCKRVFVAPESGDQDVLKNIINKSMSLEKVTESVKLFSKYGIIIDASFVLGSVGENGRSETKWEIMKTILYAWKLKMLGMGRAGFNIAIPLYNTKLREYVEKAGYIRLSPDATDTNKGKQIIETPEFTNKQVKMLAKFGDWLVNMTFREKILAVYGFIVKVLHLNNRMTLHPGK